MGFMQGIDFPHFCQDTIGELHALLDLTGHRHIHQYACDLAVLMLDIDFFKQFNDNYGHDLGDKVLKSFAEAVKKNMSERDSIIRWGGDEFVAILYGIEPKDQPLAGDRILESIRSIELKKLKGERMITASMGFSYINDSDQDIQDALERADAAVYEAKENGRNNWKIK